MGLNQTDPAEFERRIALATAATLVVAGSYMAFRNASLAQADTDMARLALSPCAACSPVRGGAGDRRSLVGTNYERFWPQLALWRRGIGGSLRNTSGNGSKC